MSGEKKKKKGKHKYGSRDDASSKANPINITAAAAAAIIVFVPPSSPANVYKGRPRSVQGLSPGPVRPPVGHTADVPGGGVRQPGAQSGVPARDQDINTARAVWTISAVRSGNNNAL